MLKYLLYLKAIEDTLVLGRVDLNAALDEVEGHNSSVSEATAQQTTKATKGKVFGGAKLNLICW